MLRPLSRWSAVTVFITAGACSNIIGISDLEIDPSLGGASGAENGGTATSGGKGSGGKSGGAGGKSSEGDAGSPDAGQPHGGGGTSSGGTSSGGTSSGGSPGASGEPGVGGEPHAGCRDAGDCDDEIACTVDECLPSGECEHTANDNACTPASGKCSSCQVGIGCVDSEPVQKNLELLLDRSFDEGTDIWQDYSDDIAILPDAAAQSGTHSVHFGPADVDADDTMFYDVLQEIYVPEGTVKLTASGWYKMVWAAQEQEDRPRADEYVTLALFSLPDENNDYTRYHDYHQWEAIETPQTTWKAFSYEAPASALKKIQGLDVTLDLVAETWDTQFYFDTLSLKASVCE